MGCVRGGPAQQPASIAPDPALIRAHAALDSGNWPEAEAQLRRYVGTHEGSAEALYLLGEALFREDRPKESLSTFTQAARLARPSALDLRFVALDYVLLDDVDDADTWITLAAKQDPDNGEILYTMGRIRQTENRFADAIACFTRALQRMPHSVKVENNLGLAYEGLNQPEKAMEAYRQAIAWQANEAHPSEQPYINLGILLSDRNQPDEALGLLKRAENLAPKDERIHGALGRLFARRGDLSEAQRELEQAVAGNSKDAGLHFQLGQVYRREGLAERAAAELQRAAELESQGRH